MGQMSLFIVVQQITLELLQLEKTGARYVQIFILVW